MPYSRPFARYRGANGAPLLRGPQWRAAITRIATLLALALAAALLAGCGARDAPTDIGVCWRVVQVKGAAPRFTPLNTGVDSLDDCAAQLEALHIQGARTVNGAYQGFFIFVDDVQVASSPHLNTFRYPIFQPSQRKVIDADLRSLIKARNGKLGATADIGVGRQ